MAQCSGYMVYGIYHTELKRWYNLFRKGIVLSFPPIVRESIDKEEEGLDSIRTLQVKRSHCIGYSVIHISMGLVMQDQV